MDIDAMDRKVRDLLIANQNMGAQIEDLETRLAALESKASTSVPVPSAPAPSAPAPAATPTNPSPTEVSPPAPKAAEPAATEPAKEPPREADKPAPAETQPNDADAKTGNDAAKTDGK